MAGWRFLVTEALCATGNLAMEELNTKPLIDYTAVPAGWLIKGHLWTGQPTVSTVTCPKCRRIGVISSQRNGQQIVVHSGRVVASGTLLGIDYCKIAMDLLRNLSEQTDFIARSFRLK